MNSEGALTWTVEQSPTEEQLQAVMGGLVAYNGSHAGEEQWSPLAVLCSQEGTVVGGAVGYTHWDWFFLSHLWVEERWRGQDVGTRLLEQIEEAARHRGCRKAHLDTFSFQALGFYEKQGYERFGTLPDYPPGHSRYFLWKRLSE